MMFRPGSSELFPPARSARHMRSSRRFFAIALATAACSSTDKTTSAAPTGGTLIMATLGEPATVFPPLVFEINGGGGQDLVFDRLAEIDSGLHTVGDKSFSPRLAKSWTWSPDSLSIAFAINPAARWHDGK